MNKLQFQKFDEWLKNYIDTPTRRGSKMVLSLERSGINNFVVFMYFLIYCPCYNYTINFLRWPISSTFLQKKKKNRCLICTNNFITAH